MFFSSDQQRRQAELVAFFALSGGGLGLLAGGLVAIFKGAPLNKVIPKAVFRTSAFFATVSALQIAVETGRQEKDGWNPLIAGAGTGFIFGHGLYRSNRIGLALALNAALINWTLQSFNPFKSADYLRSAADFLNPVLTESKSDPLISKIKELRNDIEELQKNNKNKDKNY